jgi:predicted phage-related endonuclease
VCELSPQTCEDASFEGTALEVFNAKAQAVIQKISELVKAKADIETQEKKMREQLQQAMEAHEIKQFDNDVIKVTYVEASTRNSIDSTKLKNKYPDIAAECTKTSSVKAFVKIELKGSKSA